MADQYVPYSQVLSTFAGMKDGLEQLEKAYPGLSKPMGYLAHVKVDNTTGAWMLKVPTEVKKEIEIHNYVETAKGKNMTNMGQRPTTMGAAATSAQPVAANKKLSKKDMLARAQQPQSAAGMPVPAPEPDDGQTGTVDPAAAGSRPAPQPQMNGMQPDANIGTPSVTPLLASLLPTKKAGM